MPRRRSLTHLPCHCVVALLTVALLHLSACRTPRDAPPAGETSPGRREAAPEVAGGVSGGNEEIELSEEALGERTFTGRAHTYRFKLEQGQSVHLRVDQLGVDVVCELTDPDGESVIVADGLMGAWGAEDVFWLAERTGVYRLRVHGSPAASGRYELDVLRMDRGGRDAPEKARAAQLFDSAERLRRTGRSALESLALYEESLVLWQQLGEQARQAETLYRLGYLHTQRNEHRTAAEHYERAWRLFEAAGDSRSQASALNQLGRARFVLGETEAAIGHYQQSLELRVALADPLALAFSFNNLGLAHVALAEYQSALSSYAEALERYREAGARHHEGRLLHDRGKCYLYLGQFHQALDDLNRALAIHEELGKQTDVARALNGLGLVYEAQARYSRQEEDVQDERAYLAQALGFLERARGIYADTGDRRLQATTLIILGRVHGWLGDEGRALESFSLALPMVRDLGDRLREALILYDKGSLLLSRGQARRALEYLRAALPLSAQAGGQLRVDVLAKIAFAERAEGHLGSARRFIEEALEECEELRLKPVSHALRSSFFALRQNFYDFYVDLLMEFHRRSPEGGYDALALAASERARARSQLEALIESGADLRRGADDRLLVDERRLAKQINDVELRRLRLLDDPLASGQLAAAGRELRALLRRYEQVRSEIHLSNPRYSALARPRLLRAKEIRQLLDEDSLLLHYKLGGERSYVWALTRDRLASFELPGRERLERLARRSYDLLVLGHRRESRMPTHRVLAALSRTLLEPVADLLPGRRLLITAEGALEYVPFAALPRPVTARGKGVVPTGAAPVQPMAASCEITYIPSASTMAELRRQLVRRKSAEGMLAVVADPVFRHHDPRYRSGSTTGTGAERRTAGPSGGFERLVHSEQEALSILALVPPEQRFQALGFAANRDTIASGVLAGFQRVHFATHGYVDAEQPSLSRLVLSLIDEAGRPRDGFLFAHEIYDLHLPAELVVLSACRTALGNEVRGEGLVGLTQAFLYAGAARVLVSLWPVNDLATAELMARFYRHLLEEKRRPAEALSLAQLSVAREKRWHAPYYWAAFVLRGDL